MSSQGGGQYPDNNRAGERNVAPRFADVSATPPPPTSRSGLTPIDTARRRGRRNFAGGLLLGLVLGFFAMLIAIVLLARPTLFRPSQTDSNPDLWVSISSSYLNDVVQRRLTSQPVDVSVGKITALQMGLAEANAGLTLTPTFDLSLITVEPSVDIQLGITDGKITGAMTGQPRFGNISVPLEALPFDADKVVRDGVNQVVNDVLLYELNQSFSAGFGSDEFDITQVSTSGNFLIVKMRRQE